MVMWELAHRRREETEAVYVRIEAETSGEAIEQLRLQMPAKHVVLYVRASDRSLPASAPSDTDASS